MEYHIDPVAKPRMTRRDKWLKPCRPQVQKYRNFCTQVALEKVRLNPSGAYIRFILRMPDSWSEKRKIEHNGKPHMRRPDLDNLVKGLLDALYENDAVVWDFHAQKTWGRSGMILITHDD